MAHPLFFVGSLPHKSRKEAIRFVENYAEDLPFLPQLPELNPQEDMIGQVLRGMEMGLWDDQASIAFKPFISTFANAKRAKIQIAGPVTVARTLCVDATSLFDPWKNLCKGITSQMRHGGFQGELWLQIDEPFWDKKKPLPPTYTKFLESIRTPKQKIGVHTCGLPRPDLSDEMVREFDFISMDFLAAPMTSDETVLWAKHLASEKKILVAGILNEEGNPEYESIGLLKGNPSIWLSSPCGHATWSDAKLQRFLKGISKT